MHIYTNCLYCNSVTTNPMFCNRSCSAHYYNNIRLKKTKPICKVCSSETKEHGRMFCSPKCSAMHKNKDANPKASTKARQAKYRAKGYRKLHPEANPKAIREIYKNCPQGYEVDHIIPLSLGGWHHENNLQYLTFEENRKKNNRYIG